MAGTDGHESRALHAAPLGGGDEGDRHTGEIRRVTWVGLIINIAISALKLVVGTLSSSQAVVADGVHSLSDMTTDVAVLVGVRFWTSPADDGHAYGHRRIETMITLGIGVALGLVALGIAYRGLSTIRAEHMEQPGLMALAAAVVSIVAKEILYRWTVSVGRRTKSSAVVANAWHHRSDALSSIPAALAVGLAVISPTLSFVDHLGAAVVAVFILHASWRIVKPALMELSEESAPAEIRQRIAEVAEGTDGVDGVHAVRTRRAGPGIFVDLHVTVDGGISVLRGHDVSEDVARRIQKHIPEVVDVVVHMEPSRLDRTDEGGGRDI